jgi:hypothetical protein
VMDGQGDFFSIRSAGNRARGWRCHGRRLGAQACHLEHQKLTRLLLRGLGNEMERFCSPTAMKMDGEVDNGEAAWVNLGDDASDVWWSSVPGNGSSGSSGGRESSKQQLDA